MGHELMIRSQSITGRTPSYWGVMWGVSAPRMPKRMRPRRLDPERHAPQRMLDDEIIPHYTPAANIQTRLYSSSFWQLT